MIIAVILLVLSVLGLMFMQNAKKFNIKGANALLITVAIVATVIICISAPQMHKQFSFNIIDYLIKFNDDGSMSTTKQTTQTILNKQQTGDINKWKNF